MRDGVSRVGRVLLNLRNGRPEVRDDIILDYLFGRLSPAARESFEARVAADPRLEQHVAWIGATVLFCNKAAAPTDESDVPDDMIALAEAIARAQRRG